MANNLLQMTTGKAHDNIDSLMLGGYKGTLPLTMEMFPEKRWQDDQGRQWTSNIRTRLEKDNGKWYLYPTMMGGLDLPEVGAYRGALKGKHFGVYDSYDEGMKADKTIHEYFDSIKGYQDGGQVDESLLGRLVGKAKEFSVPKALGKIKRKNPEWTGEIGRQVGEHGISIRPSPAWLSRGREFTLGNTIFLPGGKKFFEDVEGLGDDYYQDVIKDTIEYELPHVAQWREEGLGGFALEHARGLLKHGIGEKTYDITPEEGLTHESFHYSNPQEKQRLMNVLGMQSGGPIKNLYSML